MILATQYYRPPFPNRARWREDLTQIRATGFDAIYVAAPWSWIEPEPGRFVFDDFDALFGLAADAGLRVIVNLWSEIQPLWIHRELPGAELVDHLGRAVISSQLAYMHFGLTPGACTDHLQVRDRAARFFAETVRHYAGTENLLAWDCWNEMRWMAQSDGHVCFCDHTIDRYRAWLAARYGSLDGLNAALQRRYCAWEDVRAPKLPTRTYMDCVLWQEFITARTAEDLRWRYKQVRACDASRAIIAHAAFPSIFATGEFFEFETALARGNDWDLAKQVDGYGCSHFPAWFHGSPADYGARLEAGRCAAGDKPYWIGELQGGAAGHGLQAMAPVPGPTQERWVWNAIARGAKGVNFWCWRDEVFGRESGGFGIIGDDGHALERVEHLRRSAGVLNRNAALLDGYYPAPTSVGVLFEPHAYRLDWASHLATGLAPSKEAPFPAGHSLQGYLRALERLQVPYDVVESAQRADLNRYRLLILPWPLVVSPELHAPLVAWVRAGGTLLAEAGFDSFDTRGVYRYPTERPLANSLGVVSEGRRVLGERSLPFKLDDTEGTLRLTRWVEPLQATSSESLVPASNVTALTRTRLGAGMIVAAGSFLGLAYWEERYGDFERFIATLVRIAGVSPALSCDIADGDRLQWRFGRSGKDWLLFLINHGEAALTRWSVHAPDLAALGAGIDLLTSRATTAGMATGVRSFEFEIDADACHVLHFNTQR